MIGAGFSGAAGSILASMTPTAFISSGAVSRSGSMVMGDCSNTSSGGVAGAAASADAFGEGSVSLIGSPFVNSTGGVTSFAAPSGVPMSGAGVICSGACSAGLGSSESGSSGNGLKFRSSVSSTRDQIASAFRSAPPSPHETRQSDRPSVGSPMTLSPSPRPEFWPTTWRRSAMDSRRSSCTVTVTDGTSMMFSRTSATAASISSTPWRRTSSGNIFSTTEAAKRSPSRAFFCSLSPGLRPGAKTPWSRHQGFPLSGVQAR